MQRMNSEINPRVTCQIPMHNRGCGMLGAQAPSFALLFIILLSWVVCAPLAGQTNSLSTLNILQSLKPDDAGSVVAPDSTLAQGADFASNSIRSLGAAPGKSMTNAKRLKTASGALGFSKASTLCFQPGAGWVQRLVSEGNADSAFQSKPASALADTTKARRLPQIVDANDCAPSAAAGNPVLAEQSTLDNTGLLIPAPGQSDASLLYSVGSPQASGGIAPTVSPEGEVGFSLSSSGPAQLTSPDGSSLAPMSVPIYSFSPGRDSERSQASLGEQASHFSTSTPKMGRDRGVGQGSAEWRGPASSATAEMPISSLDIHEYRQLKNICLKEVQAQVAGHASGASSDAAALGMRAGHQATELLRLGGSCELFLSMGRDAAIRKMQQHSGLR